MSRTNSATEATRIFSITRPRCTLIVPSATGHDVFQHFAFARREACDASTDVVPFDACLARMVIVLQRAADGREQVRAIHGFGEKVRRAALHRLSAHGHVRAAGEKDDSPAASSAVTKAITAKSKLARASRRRNHTSACTNASVRHAEAIIDHTTVTQLMTSSSSYASASIRLRPDFDDRTLHCFAQAPVSPNVLTS